MTCDEPQKFDLQVSRKGLLSSARAISKLAKQNSAFECLLTHDGSELRFNLTGGSVGVPAIGYWDGLVGVPGAIAIELYRMMPDGDPVRFVVRDGRLHIGNHAVTCSTAPFRSVPITVPVNATHEAFVHIALSRTPEEIDASGLRSRVDEALQTKEWNLKYASRLLAAYGVRGEEVETLVTHGIERVRA